MTAVSKISFETVAPVAGIVQARDGRSASVLLDGVATQARIAVGCLVQPEPGDLVLLSAAAGTLWLTAVLDRPAGAPLRLVAEGDLAIAATGDLTIDAGGQARLTAGRIALHAGLLQVVVDEVLHVGRRVTAHVGRLRVVGELLETVAEHVLLRTRRSSRFVEDSDQARCGDIDYRATGTLQLQADTAFVAAETLVRFDAAQIHMG